MFVSGENVDHVWWCPGRTGVKSSSVEAGVGSEGWGGGGGGGEGGSPSQVIPALCI